MHYSIALVTESLPTYDDIADKLAPFQEYDGCTTPDMVLEAVQNDKREHFLEHYNEVRPFYINGDKISLIWYGGISELNTLTKEHRQRLQGFNDIFVKVLFSDVPDDITEQDFMTKYGRFHDNDKSPFTFSATKAFGYTFKEWRDAILHELYKIHPELYGHVTRLDVWVWGHGMIRPTPGFIWGDARRRAQAAKPPVWCAHTDLSGIAIFEEAQHHGIIASESAMKHLGHNFQTSL